MKRRTTLSALILVALSFASCGNSSEQEKTESVELTTTDNQMEDSVDEDLAPDDQSSLLSAPDSEEWDQMLDEYEEYVDSYISFYKKAMKGDMSALASYPEMLEKAESLQKSIGNAHSSDQLSIRQITRMSEIQTKMLKGIQ
ncbi:MAG: DUF6591 domain-containing protein [Arcticibacter sp.]